MPRNLSRLMKTSNARDKILPAMIFMIMVLSGFSYFLIQEGNFHGDDIKTESSGLDPFNDKIAPHGSLETSINENMMPSLQMRGSRASSVDLDLQYILGYGSMIGFLNSINSADIDNDGKEEIVFGNEEGFVYVMERQGNDLMKEWVSPSLGGKTYGLALGDVDSDSTIEIIVGAADGIVRIFGWNGETYEMEWESPDLGNFAYGLDVGNIDDDEYNEIVIGTGDLWFYFNSIGLRGAFGWPSSVEENLFVFGYNGISIEQEWNTTIETSYNFTGNYNVVIGDTDGDLTDEIIIGTFEQDIENDEYWGKSCVYKFTGTTYSFEGNISEFNDWVMGIGIGDTDDDNDLEITFGVYEDAIYVYGYQDPVYSLEWQSIFTSPFALTVDDTDNDGIAEIVESDGDTVNIYEPLGPLYSQTWTSGDLDRWVSGLGIGQTDGNPPNEILIGNDVSILVYGEESPGYEQKAIAEGFGEIVSLAAWDMDENDLTELYVLSKEGITQILEFDDDEDDFQIKNTIDLSDEGNRFTNIVIADFDGDDEKEICIVHGNTEISYDGGLSRSWGGGSTLFFIEYTGSDYSVVDQVNIIDNSIFSVDIGDLDNDGRVEIAAGGTNGDLIIAGYVGSSYQIEDQIHVADDILINCVGIGDTDGDGTLEIGLGDESEEFPPGPSFIHIYGFDGTNYVEEWSTTFSEWRVPLALETGSIDEDEHEEIFIKEYFSGPLSIYGWNGNNYDLEEQLDNYDMTFDEGLLIGEIITQINPQFIIGSLNTTIIEFDNGYSEIWVSEDYETNPHSVEIADIDDSWGNELILAIKTSIFIYSAGEPPEANLSVDNDIVIIGEEIIFDGSNSFGDEPLDYFFDFGDGKNTGWTADSMVTHAYSATGTYIASLKVRDNEGIESTNTAKETITVLKPNQAPIAYIDKINPNPATEGEKVSFSGHGFDEDGTITSYSWESDIDGNLSGFESFSYSSLSVGTHTISFKVMDDRETWSDSVGTTLKIKPKPQNQAPIAYIDSISPNPAIEGQTVTFTGYGTDGDGKIASYSWESDIDGWLSDKSSFSTFSLLIGKHSISFKVKDNNEAWSEPNTATLTIDPIPENQAPIAYIDRITPNPAIEGETIIFEGHGMDSDGKINSYSWESDIDGRLSSRRSFSTSSLSAGEHVITFKVKDDKDIWSESETIILVMKEKEDTESGTGIWDGDNNKLIAILLGALALVVIIIMASTMAKKSKRDSSIAAVQISCPDCGSAFGVTSSFRPITVQCPHCGLSGVLYE